VVLCFVRFVFGLLTCSHSGDAPQQAVLWKTIKDISFVCRDSSLDGIADVGTCISWSNQALATGSLKNYFCTDIYSSPQTTPSKCDCGSTNIVGLNVCLASQRQCRGSDGQVNTAPCKPTFTARVKITASSKSTIYPPASILYGNLFYDFSPIDQKMSIAYFDQSVMPASFQAGK
jgi:hypothetical protein